MAKRPTRFRINPITALQGSARGPETEERQRLRAMFQQRANQNAILNRVDQVGDNIADRGGDVAPGMIPSIQGSARGPDEEERQRMQAMLGAPPIIDQDPGAATDIQGQIRTASEAREALQNNARTRILSRTQREAIMRRRRILINQENQQGQPDGAPAPPVQTQPTAARIGQQQQTTVSQAPPLAIPPQLGAPNLEAARASMGPQQQQQQPQQAAFGRPLLGFPNDPNNPKSRRIARNPFGPRPIPG